MFFSKMIEEQVILSRADVNTGIVLDEGFLYATDPSQTVYTVYPDLKTAISAAESIIKNRPEVECYIHNKDMVLLKFLSIN